MDDQLIDELVGRARAEGLQVTGEGGLLHPLTNGLLESALEGGLTDHLGYDKHDPAGKNGANSRKGKHSKTVLADGGSVEATVPETAAWAEGSAEARRRPVGLHDPRGAQRGLHPAGRRRDLGRARR